MNKDDKFTLKFITNIFLLFLFLSELPSSALCLTVCPFSPIYFLAGFEDGSISLYSRLTQSPLITMINKETNTCRIKHIEWSYIKPCIIYALDENNMIHIWDLSKSDMSPMESVTLKDCISYLKLAPADVYRSKKAVMKSHMVNWHLR